MLVPQPISVPQCTSQKPSQFTGLIPKPVFSHEGATASTTTNKIGGTGEVYRSFALGAPSIPQFRPPNVYTPYTPSYPLPTYGSKPILPGEREDGELSDSGDVGVGMDMKMAPNQSDSFVASSYWNTDPVVGSGGPSQPIMRCRHQGCKFEGAAGVVRDHYRSSHVRDIVQKQHKRYAQENMPVPHLPPLDTAEEVARWREARRKNWPTAANIRKKMVENQIKNENRQKKKSNKRPRNKGLQNEFSDVQTVGGANEIDVEQEEGVAKKQKTDIDELVLISAPSGLASLADYGSDSSDNASEAEGAKESNEPPPSTSSPRKEKGGKKGKKEAIMCRFIANGNKCKNGRRCRFSHDVNGTSKPGVRPVKPQKTSLLKKLLASDIRQENIALLQCVRHIINTKFLTEAIPSTTL